MVKILNGNTFGVGDARGDIETLLNDPTGLFSFDTRFLSKWLPTLNGDRLTVLSTDDLQYFEARFFLVPGVGSVYVNATVSVIRQRCSRKSCRSSTTTTRPSTSRFGSMPILTSRICSRSRTRCRRRAPTRSTSRAARLVLTYRRDTYERSTAISSPNPARSTRNRAAVRDHGRAARSLDDRTLCRHRAQWGSGRVDRNGIDDAGVLGAHRRARRLRHAEPRTPTGRPGWPCTIGPVVADSRRASRPG